MAAGTRSDSPDEQADGQAGSAELVAAREGSAHAARRLVDAHGAGMLRTAWRVLGSYGSREAEDVVQEALIAALTTPALPAGDVGAWLRSIAARKALDHLRVARRRAEQPLPETDEASPAFTAADGEARRLDVLAARRALAALSPTDRAVLTLVDLEGHSMAEAAAALGVTYVAVRLRAVRARRKLARLLRADARVIAEGPR